MLRGNWFPSGVPVSNQELDVPKLNASADKILKYLINTNLCPTTPSCDS